MKRIAFYHRSTVMVAMEDNESCGSGVQHRAKTTSSPAQSRQQRQKVEVYNEILRRLKDSGHEEARQPGFDDQLWTHFNRLPTRSFPRIFSSLIYSLTYTLSPHHFVNLPTFIYTLSHSRVFRHCIRIFFYLPSLILFI